MRVAVYAGSFDPVTRGHLSVIARGAALFDRLIVLVAVNPDKHTLFSLRERVQLCAAVTSPWPNVGSEGTEGYVVDFARASGAGYLVRGVRSCTDVEGEIALAQLNRDLAPELETVFVPAHRELSEVSSSRLKELATQGADISAYCSPEVAEALQRRVARADGESQSEREHV
ncbi:MAG TPA: pantetheine-phosphate adenylyltransferase [Polyangiaceae bacterium]|nr:pantetheine-phosphate adenylyltransferase [Polyangiaceae bacterium]HMR75946.1 pantetheine-phosphate adenylyltransferase [Polyangiaceae bacterium]